MKNILGKTRGHKVECMIKKLSLICVLLILIVNFVGMTEGFAREIHEQESQSWIFSDGSGTEEDPYIIYNVHDLQNMTANLTAHYTLANDIDASETTEWDGGDGFNPVGNDTDSYWDNSNRVLHDAK